MWLKRNIPNFLTCMNLVCGCVAIHFLYGGHLVTATWLVLAAAAFDFSDGFVARLLHVKSEIGKQLDSLADVISFGLAPGVAMFMLLQLSLSAWPVGLPSYTPFLAFIIPAFSAVRLAIFNVDERQTSSFRGLPTPANGILIMSLLPLISKQYLSPLFPWNDYLFFFILHPAILISGTLLLSFLLVSNVPLFAMKFSGFGWKGNQLRYIFIITSLVLIVLFYFVAVPMVILLYIVLSLFQYKSLKSAEQKSAE
ncbi:MAG: CDP-alcohol phosphatidyltransferase family protein [Bacteroidota bacterium]